MHIVKPRTNERQNGAERRRRRRALLAALTVATLLTVAAAKDSLMASAYAPVVTDLIAAFRAEETLCPLATYQHDVCFVASPAGAGQLAEVLSSVVAGYAPADLRVGDWRAANGVWAVSLSFGGGGYGWVELYLSEVELGAVRGTFIFHEPR